MNKFNNIEMTSGGQKKLGNLAYFKDQTITDAIKQRGEGQGQVNKLRSDYQHLKVDELANLAALGDSDAETAIKILKQARKKREKYGNQ